jgi:hypothetical protein
MRILIAAAAILAALIQPTFADSCPSQGEAIRNSDLQQQADAIYLARLAGYRRECTYLYSGTPAFGGCWAQVNDRTERLWKKVIDAWQHCDRDWLITYINGEHENDGGPIVGPGTARPIIAGKADGGTGKYVAPEVIRRHECRQQFTFGSPSYQQCLRQNDN